MAEFPKLYKITNTKKLYEWTICVNKKDETNYEIISTHGEKDGKKITHSTLISKGKAKRSTLEQAQLEAKSKWNNKYNKSGYRPLGESGESNEINKQIIRPIVSISI